MGSGRDYIISLDAESGELLGNDGFATPRRSLGAPVIGAERVAFRTRDRVHLFDIESGNHEFFGVLEDLEHVAAGHSVVVALSAARVVVFDEDEEQPWWERWRRWWYQLDIFGVAPHVPPQPQRWNARTGCEPLAPVIAPRMLFVGCEMGRVRAYDLETGAEQWTHEGMALVDSPVLLERGLLLVGAVSARPSRSRERRGDRAPRARQGAHSAGHADRAGHLHRHSRERTARDPLSAARVQGFVRSETTATLVASLA